MNRRAWFGSGFALLSAMSFAINVPFVGLVYEHAGNIQAVNLVRPWFFLLCLLPWVFVRRTPLWLPAHPRNWSFLIGALFCLEFYAVHSAIRHIPTGLAILIMYVYPLMVALIASGLMRRVPRPGLILAMLVVLGGLALALGAPSAVFDVRGVGLSLLAAIGMTLIVIISERTMVGFDRDAVMVHAMSFACVVVLLLTLAGPPLQWPTDTLGIGALAIATVLYTLATFMLFVAVSQIGPIRFAIIDNTSPVWTTMFGMLILNETLSWSQAAGSVLVIGGVIAAQLLAPPIAPGGGGVPPEHPG